MRKKVIAQRSIFDQAIYVLISILKPEKKLKRMDKVIDENPQILDVVHRDLTSSVKKSGRKGLSAERVLRCAVLKQLKNYSYRELRERVNDGVGLRWFTRFYSDRLPHFTALQKAIKAIQPQTWKQINDILVQFAKDRKIEDGRSIRVDTTVAESNIAYPLDARLLNDSVRVLTRIMQRAIELVPGLNFALVKRTRRAKKRCYQIIMAKGTKAEQMRKKHYKDLIKVANEVYHMATVCCQKLADSPHLEAWALHEQLDHYLTLAAVAIDQCERRILKGETVPTEEKIVSIFEEHTDIIKRGKSQSPTEFGHKVLVVSGKSNIITQYETFRGNPSDEGMLMDILDQHQQQYQKAPWNLSGDRRFFSAANEAQAYQSGVKKVSICKPGYRSKDRKQLEKKPWFKRLQHFRAGIEGIISGLMRGYGLKRCLWKGWQAFQSYVGLSIVTFNLQKIAQLL
jgi:IS5 family transposase